MRPCLLAGLALVLCGCGLADYEARMLDAQQRAQRFEEESNLLDQPVQIPQATNKDGNKYPIANAFFRPPKGIELTPSNEKSPRNGRLYTYRPRSEKAAAPFLYVELAFGDDDKKFANEILQAFTVPGNLTWRQRQISAPGRPAVSFNTAEFEDGPYYYSVNLTRAGSGQAAVVYWLDKANRNSGAKAMQMSLESFAVGDEAGHRRALLTKGSPLTKVPGPN